jgi:hypothetical protein
MRPALAPLLVTLALGCGGESELLSEAERGRSEGTLFKLEAGERGVEIGERVKLPPDFPRDVPLYPGAEARMSLAGGEEGMVVTLTSEDEADEVFDFYRSKLESEGWSIEGEMRFGQQAMLHCAKEGRSASVTVSGSDEGSSITLAVGKPR